MYPNRDSLIEYPLQSDHMLKPLSHLVREPL